MEEGINVEVMARSVLGIAELYTERPVSAARGKGVTACGCLWVSVGETEISLDKVGMVLRAARCQRPQSKFATGRQLYASEERAAVK
jgi:hypothetical protein